MEKLENFEHFSSYKFNMKMQKLNFTIFRIFQIYQISIHRVTKLPYVLDKRAAAKSNSPFPMVLETELVSFENEKAVEIG